MPQPDALAGDLLEGLADLPIDEVRARRAACQQLETQLSYVRRLAQGRLDIVASEITARREGTQGDRTLVQQLTDALADRITAPGYGHLPMVLAPGDVDADLLAGLDGAAPPAQVSSPSSMGDEELRAVADALAEFERDVSARRRAMFDRIDALQAEIVRRYQSGEVTVDSLLGPSGPAERETLGPSGPEERETQGPSGPAERETLGPSGPAERETLGP